MASGFPAKENDGATGWQFMTAKFGRAWICKEVPRGPWHYDGEIDLGYGAGLRAAATVLTQTDPEELPNKIQASIREYKTGGTHRWLT